MRRLCTMQSIYNIVTKFSTRQSSSLLSSSLNLDPVSFPFDATVYPPRPRSDDTALLRLYLILSLLTTVPNASPSSRSAIYSQTHKLAISSPQTLTLFPRTPLPLSLPPRRPFPNPPSSREFRKNHTLVSSSPFTPGISLSPMASSANTTSYPNSAAWRAVVETQT